MINPRCGVQPFIKSSIEPARKFFTFDRSKSSAASKKNDKDGDDQDDKNTQRGYQSIDNQNQQESREVATGKISPPIIPAAPSKWTARFTPPNPLPAFKWKWLDNTNVDPAIKSYSCCRLLAKDCFIDKSAALYFLLNDFFDYNVGDFESVPLRLVYPRRFAKTTLLGFIEAVFSPVANLDNYDMEHVKNKIAVLECGEKLLSFGLHPVLRLELTGISSVRALNSHIDEQLEQAGLVKFASKKKKRMNPMERVSYGVKMLNEKFMAETGVATKTIVLIDEHDKPFRDRKVSKEKEKLNEAIIDLFSLGKRSVVTGISLLVFCGLTRMVGSGLSSMNNLVDVSRMTNYHGLCGISAKELIRCAAGQLDSFTKKQYGGKFSFVLQNEFAKKWNGFRFGIDQNVGLLDPDSSEGALFSPLDVWEIVQSLVKKRQTTPSSRWINSMESDFEFSSFEKTFTSTPDGYVALFQNLDGGWVDAADINLKMKREDYLLLKEELHIQKVLFELGLLSVKSIDDRNQVLLFSPNDLVTENALKFLLRKTNYRDPLEDKAQEFMSEAGFGIIMSRAAIVLSNMYHGVREDAINESVFQSTIYRELSYRFPNKASENYKLYKEVRPSIQPLLR